MLRKLHKSDLPFLLAIEQAVQPIPWTEETFHICFEAECLGWVLMAENELVGFIMMALQGDECHVLNLGLMHSYQGKGFGRVLLESAMDYASHQGAKIIYLEVRRSNTKAITLYQRMKFEQITERKNYYPTLEGREDALVFAKSLG